MAFAALLGDSVVKELTDILMNTAMTEVDKLIGPRIGGIGTIKTVVNAVTDLPGTLEQSKSDIKSTITGHVAIKVKAAIDALPKKSSDALAARKNPISSPPKNVDVVSGNPTDAHAVSDAPADVNGVSWESSGGGRKTRRYRRRGRKSRRG